MLTNAQTATLRAAVKAYGTLDNAQGAFAKRVGEMREAGFTAEMLDTKSERIGEIREAVAASVLTPAQVKLWADTSKAVKIAGNDGKRLDTPRGKLVKVVDMRISRIRAALTVQPAKGAKGNEARALKERVTVEIGKLHKAVTKDATGDAPQLDNKIRSELLAAFQRALDLVK
jgi:hypothetical protein